MENKYKISGWALSIYGGFTLLTFLVTYSSLTAHFGPINNFYWLKIVLVNIAIALSFLALLCGIYLLRNNSTVHKIALPVSVALLLSFPVGTIAGGLYLWQRHEST